MADDPKPVIAGPPEGVTLPSGGDVPRPALVAAGRYELLRCLGRGASKEVYLARDTVLDREVAVGLIVNARVEGALRTRLMREVRTTARLDDHPHIVTVHDVGEEQGVPWIVSQYVSEGSVADLLTRHPDGLPIPDAVRIGSQVADALAFAHDHGVIHRDVKPSNVLLVDRQTALLTDFGIALLADQSRLTEEGVPVGTASYMSPEQARGDAVDLRCDLYALGATLFELVCGHPPFVGGVVEVIAQHLNRPPPDPRTINPAVPDDLAALIVRLLSKWPDDRPASAQAVRETLEARDVPVTTGRTSAPVVAALPEALTGEPERSFVGREDAMEALRRSWRRAATGYPALALVSGEPGIGKTSLAAAFAQEAHDAGTITLYGRCDEDPLVSYQPFVEALRHLVSMRPTLAAELDPRWTPELAELGRLVPELRGQGVAPAATEGGANPERYLLFEAVVALLSTAAAHGPLLLVLDDLQWADKPTALLLRHLMRSPVAGSVMVLGTARRDDLTPAHPLAGVVADLARQARGGADRLARVALDGLDEQETQALVGAREQRAVDREFVRLLHEETAGNPFFIEEALRGLRDADLSAAEDAASALRSLGVPAGAKELIQRRLARIDPATVELLTRASVCGAEFRLDVLAALLGLSAAQAAAPVEEAIAAGLVVEPSIGRYTFCHALVRETLYGSVLSEANRARLHLAVGEALEELDGERASAPELALHFHAALAVGGAERAVNYALAAAAGAAKALAYEEAAAYRLRACDALAFLGRDAERGRLLHSVGRLRWQAGDRAGAQEAFLLEAELARQVDDAQVLARAALGYAGRSYDAEAIDPQLRGLLEEALERTPQADTALRAKLQARYAEALHPIDGGRAIELSREAVAIARQSGDEDALVAALAGHHTTLLHIAHLPERLSVGAEWVERAQSPRRDNLGQALHWRMYDLFEIGNLDAALSAHEQLHALAEELRQPLYRHFAASWDTKWLEIAGRFGDAEAQARKAREDGRRMQGVHVRMLYAGQIFGLRREQGRLGEVARDVAKLVGPNATLPAWRAGLVAARCEAGERPAAQAELTALARDDFAAIPPDMFWLGALCLLAEGAAALGDRAVAAQLAGQLDPYAEYNAQIGLAMFLGPVHLFLGVLTKLAGDRAAASRHFEVALERAAGLGMLTAEARAQCEYAELLLADGGEPERLRGLELLERARMTAQQTGMAALLERTTAARERVIHAGR
jgi:Protein kinase domain/AAA ATPase domain